MSWASLVEAHKEHWSDPFINRCRSHWSWNMLKHARISVVIGADISKLERGPLCTCKRQWWRYRTSCTHLGPSFQASSRAANIWSMSSIGTSRSLRRATLWYCSSGKALGEIPQCDHASVGRIQGCEKLCNPLAWDLWQTQTQKTTVEFFFPKEAITIGVKAAKKVGQGSAKFRQKEIHNLFVSPVAGCRNGLRGLRPFWPATFTHGSNWKSIWCESAKGLHQNRWCFAPWEGCSWHVAITFCTPGSQLPKHWWSRCWHQSFTPSDFNTGWAGSKCHWLRWFLRCFGSSPQDCRPVRKWPNSSSIARTNSELVPTFRL